MKKIKNTIVVLLASVALASCAGTSENTQEERSYEYVPAPSPPVPPPVYTDEDLVVGSPGDGYAYEEEYESEPEYRVRSLEIPEAAQPTITFDDVEAQLSSASFGYEVPTEMNIDEEAIVRLVINPAKSEAQIETALGDGTVYTSTILVSKVLKAELTSRDFEIIPLSPERQALDDNEDTVWTWSIKPNSAGDNRTLKISVSALITIDGDRVERFIETYEGTVQVDITTKQILTKWLEDNWQWAWGALLLPIGAWFLKFRKPSKPSTDK